MARTSKTPVSRSRFATTIGFIVSGVGSAVGLGSFWRFPQLTSQNGGGAFVFLFIAMLVLFAVPLLWAELAIGQRAQESPILAFERLAGRRWRVVGFLFVAVSFVFLGYYTVLTGTILRYTLLSFGQGIVGGPGDYLATAAQGTSTVLWALLAALVTGGIVALGVAKGLERANLVMMPALLLMLVGLVIYALSQSGAAAGLDFYLSVDFSKIRISTVQAALGQVFFAVGIGFGIMLTYASYTTRGRTLLLSSSAISGSILVVGFLAGLMIFPLVFTHGLEASVIDPQAAPTTTLLLTMPSTFADIGGGLGKSLMFGFFLMLFFAALSSTISVLEVLVGMLRDEFGWSRLRANWIASEFYFIPGVFAATSVGVFGWINAFLDPLLFISVIGLCLVYTFAIKDRVGLLLSGRTDATRIERGAARAAAFITSYVAPVALGIIFLLSLPDTIRALF